MGTATAPTPVDIRTARQTAGLTQTEAAALIHCTLRGWQDWERGRRRMHPAFWELFLIKALSAPPGSAASSTKTGTAQSGSADAPSARS